MENRSRVQEIRQRFEDVNSQPRITNVSKQQPSIKPPLALKPIHLLNNSFEQPSKCIIKRSHAFRSDKSKIRPYHAVKDSVVISKKTLPSDIKLDASKSTTVVSPLSETIKKALKAPLPCGPPPKKPPRTFAHNTDGINKDIAYKMEKLEGKLDKFVQNYDGEVSNAQNNVNNNERIQQDEQSRTNRISKERLLTFIRNFENAANKKEGVHNSHVYDCPNESPDCSGSSNSTHVYSEPFKSQIPEESQKKNINSLHYMSTSIEKLKLENDSPGLEYLIIPLDKEKVEKRKEFDTVLRKTRKLLISQIDDDAEEVDDENTAPLPDYYAMLPPRSQEPNAKNRDVFDEIKSLMIEAYNKGSIKFNGDGEQAQFRALRGDASSKQLTEMISQIITDSDNRFRERCRILHRKPLPSEKLIDALLLIGLDTDSSHSNKVPYVKLKFTQPHVDIPSKVENLVFPDATSWPPLPVSPSHGPGTEHSNSYTIILTKQNGDRSYAYCRRLLPEGSSFCLPLTYVILTDNEDYIFYRKILDQVEINHGLPEHEYNKFIKDLLDLHFPKRGGSLILDEVEITRHEDNSPYEYVISQLLKDISVPVFLKLFSAMLFERKIIVVGSQVSKVCDTVEALCKCLYPFFWQHTIVSLLPSDMSELLQCPAPYIVGLLKGRNSDSQSNIFSNIENAIVVEVDSGKELKSNGDELTILPKKLIKSLKSALYSCNVRDPDSCISATLLKLFVELVGHYPLVIIHGPSGGHDRPGFRVFLRNSFVTALSSKSIEQFLRTFIDTAMFEAFLRERLDNVDFEMGLFEKSCIEFIADEVRRSPRLLKTITLNKTVKALGDQFLKED